MAKLVIINYNQPNYGTTLFTVYIAKLIQKLILTLEVLLFYQ